MYRLFLSVLLLLPTTLWSASSYWSNPGELANLISQQSDWLLLPAFYGLGLLLAFTPCVLPMVPILSGIIICQNTENSKQGFQLSFAYVMGMALTYAIAGMLAGWLGTTVQTVMQKPWIIVLFSFLFIYLGFSLLDKVRLPMMGMHNNAHAANQTAKRKSLISIAFMGVISTLVVSPCVTGPLIGVLTYIGQSGQVMMGGLLLFVLALGMGTPLLLIGSGYGKYLPKSGAWMIMVKKLFAFMMFALAVWLLSRILPNLYTQILYISLALICGFSLGLFQKATHPVEKFGQAVGVSMFLLVGALSYAFLSNGINNNQASQQAPFLQVKSEQALERYLFTAKQSQQPVFVEFFASWCSDCKAMDKQVFNQTKVHQAMSNSLNLRVDISQNDARVKAMRQKFGVLGIPTMLFIDRNGSVQHNLTAVGQVPLTTVVTHLKKING